ncbi:polysaccharide biosynthesis tyrosine autokinase [Kocuria arenosa]|uniref:polysaccharide biosynthesis tyrosine autokinase n=1 Tax=Kocuria arenosa TaxID=3071446 RepID=UPI0034D4DEC0
MERTAVKGKVRALDSQDLTRLMHTYWRSMALITLLCILLALGLSLAMPKMYTSTATGLVVATGEDDLATALTGDSLAQSRAASYESLAMSRPLAVDVISRLALDESPETLMTRITADVPPDTVEIRITADGDSPQEAADLANAWVVTLSEQVRELERVGEADAEAASRVVVQPLSDAAPPQEPSSPNMKLNFVLGVLSGLGLGFLYAMFRYRRDKSIHSVEEVRETFDVPVLGVIPTDERLTDKAQIIETGFSRGAGDHAYSEALRILRTNLTFLSVDNPPRIIVITSSLPGEGKSSITANLAVAIASTGRNVVVVDGDLRRPVMTELFGLVAGVGVTDVLTRQVPVGKVLQAYDKFPNLQVLGAGRTPPNPTELLSSRAMHSMLGTLAEDALVLVDAPPLLPVTDAALLTASADGAIIVATADVTTTENLGQSLDSLRQVHGMILGVVLNHASSFEIHSDYYGRQDNVHRAPIGDNKWIEASAPNAPVTSQHPDHGGW